MTDKTETTTDSTSDQQQDRDGSGDQPERSRTRTRSRARGRSGSGDGRSSSERSGQGSEDQGGGRSKGSGSDGAGSKSDESASSGASKARDGGKSAGDDSGDGDGGSSANRRRRRRGRRGRGGRGRGGSSGGSSDSGSSKGGSSKGGSSKGGSSKGGSSKDGSAKDGGSGGDGGSKSEKELEEAIAKGGTRTAAKRRSGRRGGTGGGGGGRHQRKPGGVPEEVRRAIMDGPPKTMLVTSREDRTQICVLEERRVVEHYVTRKEDVTYVGNIYMARVQNVLPGMEAAFLDIGKGRNGVLYAGEVLYDELDLEDAGENPRIEDALQSGQKLLVQVTKDPMGSKGPRLTMHLSLAGRYMVLSPNSDLFGISRKLTDKERDRLRRVVKRIKPKEHGVIVRTAASDASDEALEADLERLLAKWEKVEEKAKDAKALTPVYEEPPLVVKVIRDNFGPDFERAIIDDEDLFNQVRDYLEEVAPDLLDKVELYQPKVEESEKAKGLFEAYEADEQLRKAMDRKVWLPSGGYLIIEATEAMKVIDVNTGKFTGGKDSNLEEVVLKTNLEAAEEIVRQLRLRDMGGIIIIDFIDMLLKSNQDQVLRTLKKELLRDRTKTRVSDISRLGLVQMTRKNVSQGLVESFSHKCDTCNGHGYISELD